MINFTGVSSASGYPFTDASNWAIAELTYADEAFYLCKSLAQITFKNSSTTIEGQYTFAECSPVLTIICDKGSSVERYAKENEIKVKYE